MSLADFEKTWLTGGGASSSSHRRSVHASVSRGWQGAARAPCHPLIERPRPQGPPMLQYIVRRILQFIPVFFGVTLILFLIDRRSCRVIRSRCRSGEQRCRPQRLRSSSCTSTGSTSRGTCSTSSYLGNLAPRRPRASVSTGPTGHRHPQADATPTRIKLAFAAIIIEIIIGIGAGIISAVKQYSFWDVFVTLVDVHPGVPAGLLARHAAAVVLRHLAEGVDERRVLSAHLGRVRASSRRWRLLHPPGHHPGGGLDGLRRAHHAQPAARGQGQDYIRTALRQGPFRARRCSGATR